MTELLTIPELAEMLKVKPKTISNMIGKGVFREGVHFVRPAGLGTRFKRAAVEIWLENGSQGQKERITFPIHR
jgi:excisionase family DNA binding protein